MVVPDEIKKWNACVKQAKESQARKKGKSISGFGFIDKQVVKDARKCYCAMAFLTTK
jgi:hypothetical protein